MIDVHYPAVLSMPHYQVEYEIDDSGFQPYTGLFHRDRAGAERELAEWQRTYGHDPLYYALIMSYEPVFLARCGDCAEFPTGTPAIAKHWDEMRHYLAQFPGWVATSERHVLCPYHQPSKED